MKNYVLGFLFSKDVSQVVMIQKNHPDFMAGKLNGLGGLIQEGETALEAMIREFKEESGLSITDWVMFKTITGENPAGEGYAIFCYQASSEDYHKAKTNSDELVWLVPTTNLDQQKLVAPCLELIPLAARFETLKKYL